MFYVTCLAFLFYLLNGCNSKHDLRTQVKGQSNLSFPEAKKLLETYNRVLQLETNSDSFISRQKYLDTIIAHEKDYASDSSLSVLRDAYYNRGFDFDLAFQYIDAKNDFEKVLTIAQRIDYDRPRQQFSTMNRLANTYNRVGDVNRSLHMRQQQLEFSLKMDSTAFLVPTYINLGILYADLENFRDAINAYKMGLAIASSQKFDKAKLLSELASVYIDLGQPDSAFICAQQSLRQLKAFDKKDDTLEWLAQNFLTLSKIYDLRNDKAHKYSFLQQAIHAWIQRAGDERVRELGKIYLAFCKPGFIKKDDINNIHHALYTVCAVDTNNIFSLPSNRDLYAENTIMEALDAKAEWMTKYCVPAEKQKYLQCAIACYDLAFEVERKLLTNFSYDESKIRMLKESRDRSEKAIDLCYTLYEETKNDQWTATAFRFAERNKAFILLESVRRNLAASQIAQRDTSFQKVQQLQLDYAFAEKSLLEAKTSSDTAGMKQLELSLTKADEQLQLAKTALYQNSSSYRQWMEKEDSISIDIAAGLLPDDKTALIEFFAGDSASYAFVISRNQHHRFISISGRDRSIIDSFQYYFFDKNNILADPKGYQQKAHAVYSTWLRPCLEGSNLNQLLIIPDGKLNIVPFDALITAVSTGNDLQSWSYLVKDHSIALGYSVSTLLEQLNRKENKKDIVAFAPGFIQHERNLAPLPFTFEEIENINRNKRANLFRDKAATLGQFRNVANRSGIIHIASHAKADVEGGMPSIEFIDSTILLNELYAMPVNADLVVLSACETGIGKIEKGEGALSLARGFYYAGAKNIITSLWSINDHSTATLFRNFYADISGNKYSYALHQAKKDYLSAEMTNDKYSPYYWAGFICIGIDDANVEKDRYGWIRDVLIIGVFTALILVRARIKRNKKRTRFAS